MSKVVCYCFYLKELDTILAALTTAFKRATAEKIRCQEEVNRTNKAIELANRLVKGLRWGPTGQANEAAYRKHFFVIHYWSGNNRGT